MSPRAKVRRGQDPRGKRVQVALRREEFMWQHWRKGNRWELKTDTENQQKKIEKRWGQPGKATIVENCRGGAIL